MNTDYKRGTVWWVELPINYETHIQGSTRPCVILSDTSKTPNSSVVTVCPLSTKLDVIPYHPNVFIKKPGQVLCEQITTVDVSMIGTYAGTLTGPDMAAVEYSLRELLGL